MGVLSTPLIKVGGALAPLAPPSAAHYAFPGLLYICEADARCSEVGAISTAVKDMPGSLADSMLTGASWIAPVFVGSDDHQVIEDGNEVYCLGIVNNDISTVL